MLNFECLEEEELLRNQFKKIHFILFFNSFALQSAKEKNKEYV